MHLTRQPPVVHTPERPPRRQSSLSIGTTIAVKQPFLNRVQRQELRRKSCHIIPGFFAFIYAVVPRHDPLTLWSMLIIVGIAGTVALAFRWYSAALMRDGEENLTGAIVGYVGTFLGTLCLFPAQPEFAFVVLTVLAFGDGLATIETEMTSVRKKNMERDGTAGPSRSHQFELV